MPKQLQRLLKKVHLTVWIFIALILAIPMGLAFPGISAKYLTLLSSAVFLPMIKACIVPLVFAQLLVGIAGHGDDLARVGRLGLRALAYFISLTMLALVIGLMLANFIQPGAGIALGSGPESNEQRTIRSNSAFISLKDELGKIFQPSFFQAAVGFKPDGKPAGNGGEVLAVVVLTIIFSIGLMKVSQQEHRDTMLRFARSLSEIMLCVVRIVMSVAPLGVFGAMAGTIGRGGLGILTQLAKLIAGIIAFSCASSDAALPKALENMIEFGVPEEIVAFVLPLGYSFNLDGSTLYLAMTSLFCAQASGMNLSAGTQVYMMCVLLLTSKGIAAVPGASLVVLSATIDQFGFDPSTLAIVLGVDELMNMARACLNVVGNCLACAVLARAEGVDFNRFAASNDMKRVGDHCGLQRTSAAGNGRMHREDKTKLADTSQKDC